MQFRESLHSNCNKKLTFLSNDVRTQIYSLTKHRRVNLRNSSQITQF
jgi:hypothetical protein